MMIPLPKPGLDGLHRCVVCGTLMKEAKSHCLNCEEQSNEIKKTKLTVLVLCIAILVVAAAVIVYCRQV